MSDEAAPISAQPARPAIQAVKPNRSKRHPHGVSERNYKRAATAKHVLRAVTQKAKAS